MASITEVARLAGVSIATASRVVSESDYPVSAATRERVLDAARTLDYVPNALARGLLKSRVPVVGVIVHDITDPYFAEVVRGVEDAATPAGYLVITCSSERDAERERSYVRLLRSMRAAAVIFAGSGLDDPALNEEMGRHVAAMRADGAAVVHLSPHADGEPEVGVDNAAGIARDGGGARRPRPSRGSRSSPGRGRCTSRASGSPATAAASTTRASRSTSGWSWAPASTARAARRRRRAPRRRTRRSPPSAAPTTCSRSARSQRLAELGIDVPRDVSVAGLRRHLRGGDDGAEPLDRRACRCARWAGAASSHADRAARRRARPSARCCRPSSSCATRPARRPVPLPPPRTGPRHGSEPHEPQPPGHRSRPASSRSTRTAGSTRPPTGATSSGCCPQGPVALAINADTGEGPHLWPDERERVLRVAVDEAGDVPVDRRPVGAVHRAGGRGGQARRGGRRAGPARLPDPRLPGHAARPRHPGRLPRGDRARLRPADGRVPAPAGARAA